MTGVPADEVDLEVRRLASEYTESGRGFDLREASGGWRFYTRAECSDLVSRYITEDRRPVCPRPPWRPSPSSPIANRSAGRGSPLFEE